MTTAQQVRNLIEAKKAAARIAVKLPYILGHDLDGMEDTIEPVAKIVLEAIKAAQIQVLDRQLP